MKNTTTNEAKKVAAQIAATTDQDARRALLVAFVNYSKSGLGSERTRQARRNKVEMWGVSDHGGRILTSKEYLAECWDTLNSAKG